MAVVAALLVSVAATAGASAPAQAQSDGPDELIDVVSVTPPRRITDLAPGDSVNWAFTIKNVTDNLLPVVFAVVAPQAPPAAYDSERGLSVRVDLCSEAWIEQVDPKTGAPTYSCRGTLTPVISATPPVKENEGADAPTIDVAPGSVVAARVIVTLSPFATDELERLEFGELRLVATAEVAGESRTRVLSDVEQNERARSIGRRFAFTGSTLMPAALGGLVCFLAGVSLLIAARRRSRDELEDAL